MMRKFFWVIVFSALSTASYSQSSEIGVMIGGAGYKGDLNPHLFTPKFLGPSAGLFYRRSFNSFWSLRLGLSIASIKASDAVANDDYQRVRNLSFRNGIIDGSALFEFNFFPFQTASESSNKITPFIFSGISFFRHNPKAYYGGSWHELQPLGTEGQGSGLPGTESKYKRFQFALPIGGGIKVWLSKRFSLTVEAGARRTYTDYLDDVSTVYPDNLQLAATNGALAAALSDRSVLQQTDLNANRQRGTEADKDWYMMGGLTINWTLSKKYSDRCKPFRTKLR